jgi:paraquat-inducible protein B
MKLYAILAVVVLLSAGATWSCSKIEDWKADLVNQGTMQCVSKVNAAEHQKLQDDYKTAMNNLAAQQAMVAQLEQEKATIKAESASQHAEIAAAMKDAKPECTIPDRAIDAVNAPVRRVPPKPALQTQGKPL